MRVDRERPHGMERQASQSWASRDSCPECCLGGGVGVPKYGSSTGEGRRWVRENIPDGVVRKWKLGWLAGALPRRQRTSGILVEAGGPWGGMWQRGEVSDVEAQPGWPEWGLCLSSFNLNFWMSSSLYMSLASKKKGRPCSQCMNAPLLSTVGTSGEEVYISIVTKSCPTLLWPPLTAVHQASLSMGFPSQECWSGLPFPPPGALSNPGIKPASPDWQVASLPVSHLGSPSKILTSSVRSPSLDLSSPS